MTTEAPLRSPRELFDLDGRRAVVTGASSGIGERLALVLARAGARVVMVARRAERLQEIRDRHPELAPRLLAEVADLAEPAAPAAVARRAVECLGGCDVLVGAAGMPGRGGVRQFDPPLFERVLHLNVSSQASLASALFEPLRASGVGRVIYVASIFGLAGEGAEEMERFVGLQERQVVPALQMRVEPDGDGEAFFARPEPGAVAEFGADDVADQAGVERVTGEADARVAQ